MDKIFNLKLAWHFDFHSHRSVRIGHAPDFGGMAKVLRASGIEEIIMFAKCHNGFSYYPTKIGTPHPKMRGDVFGGVLKACRARRIKVLAYISFGIDGEAGRRHPEWAQVTARGPSSSPDHFISVCPFTGYMKELMLPQIAEIILRYRPDGFFFDTMGALGVCYCEACRKDFYAAHALDIPRKPGGAAWGLYGRFRRARGMALIKTVGDFIQARLPGALVGFNQIGSPPMPEKMPPSITRLTLDPNTRAHQSREMSFCAAYAAYADRPADIMPTIFNQGWGDWSPAHPLRLEQSAAAVWARGARLYMGDRLRPDGRLESASTKAMEVIALARQKAAIDFPPDDAAPADDVLLLHSPSLVCGEDMSQFAIDARMHLRPVEYGHFLASDAGFSTGVVAECFLRRWIKTPRLIVLPQLPSITPATSALLKSFVRSGGALLVVGTIPKVGGKPMDWLGVSREEAPWQDHVWIETADGSGPVLVRGLCHRLRLRGAKRVLSAIAPYDLKAGVKFGWGIGPVSGARGREPALTCLKLGRGAAWCLSAPLFSDYAEGANWQQAALFGGMLDLIAVAPRVRLRHSPGNAELIARRRRNEDWAVLLNHSAAQPACGGWPRVVSPLPPYPVVVEYTSGRKPSSILLDGHHITNWTLAGASLRVPVVMDGPCKVLQVAWAT